MSKSTHGPSDLSNDNYQALINNKTIVVSDAEPTGAQLLARAGLEPTDEHVIIERLPIGSRAIGSDEVIDLRATGPREFRAFRSDRLYAFSVDTHGYQWGSDTITEQEIRYMARVPEDKVLAQHFENAAPKILHPIDHVQLSAAGTEHLRTQARPQSNHGGEGPHPPHPGPSPVEPPSECPIPLPVHDEKLNLVIVVSGQPVDVVVDDKHAPLRVVIPEALEKTGNAGQPVENWELRDEPGNLLDLEKKIGAYQFPPRTHLFLSLKAGIGG